MSHQSFFIVETNVCVAQLNSLAIESTVQPNVHSSGMKALCKSLHVNGSILALPGTLVMSNKHQKSSG